MASKATAPAAQRNNRTVDSPKSLKDSPYWEYILREFVFKTISSPPQSDNVLYKKLLDAPFYGGPLPTLSTEDNALLSRGDVYHLPDGRWILCQESCVDCEPCSLEKVSLVKWTLKRIKRFISSDSYRYDLQLTVIPQFATSIANIKPGNYIYIPQKIDNIVTTTSASHVDRTRSGRSSRRLQRDQTRQLPLIENNLQSLNPLADNPSDSRSTINSPENNITDNAPIHRLIMGIDQSGKKHIIHVLSFNSYKNSTYHNEKTNNSIVNLATRLSKSYRGKFYQRYVKTVLDSISSHRPIIESFLSSNKRIKKDNPAIAFYPIYSEFIKNNTNVNFKDETNPYWAKKLMRLSRSSITTKSINSTINSQLSGPPKRLKIPSN